VVRNYNGIVPGEPLPALYPYTLFDRSVAAPEDGWTPDVVVIGLGTNDFSTELNPGETWTTREALRADVVKNYMLFVQSLRAKWPATHFILMASADHLSTEIADAMTATADGLKAQGFTDLETITFTGLDFQACHGHPSLKDDALLSQLLIDRISQLPKFAAPATP
jgi:hypothetical protein